MNFRTRQQASKKQDQEDALKDAQRQKEMLLMLQIHITAKELEGHFYKKCIKTCCKLDNDLFENAEKDCLENCFKKMEKFQEKARTFYTEKN